MVRPIYLIVLICAIGGWIPSALFSALAGQRSEAVAASQFSASDFEDVEEFLRRAKISSAKPIPVGVTRPVRVTLSDGQRTAHGIWKTIDVFKPLQRFAGGRVELSFRDSWEHEVAAYELDKLLELGRVPPVVKRRWRGDVGSLQLWLEDVMTEADRLQELIAAPDTEDWNRQMYTVRFIHNLCDDSDFNNVGNLLIDKDFHVWIIDHSRSFRNGQELRSPEDLDRFSRKLLDKARALDFALLSEHLGDWLSKRQIETLLVRRDLILERAESLVASQGEDKVLYP